MVRVFLLFFPIFCFSATESVEDLFQAQSNDYKNKNYSKVMARGHYYRANYLRNNTEIKAAFSPNLFKYEIYALAEFCQWELVDKLTQTFKEFEKIKYTNFEESQKLQKKLESFKAYKLVSKESSEESSKDKASLLVDSIDWQKIDNLSDINVEVEDLCQK